MSVSLITILCMFCCRINSLWQLGELTRTSRGSVGGNSVWLMSSEHRTSTQLQGRTADWHESDSTPLSWHWQQTRDSITTHYTQLGEKFWLLCTVILVLSDGVLEAPFCSFHLWHCDVTELLFNKLLGFKPHWKHRTYTVTTINQWNTTGTTQCRSKRPKSVWMLSLMLLTQKESSD